MSRSWGALQPIIDDRRHAIHIHSSLHHTTAREAWLKFGRFNIILALADLTSVSALEIDQKTSCPTATVAGSMIGIPSQSLNGDGSAVIIGRTTVDSGNLTDINMVSPKYTLLRQLSQA